MLTADVIISKDVIMKAEDTDVCNIVSEMFNKMYLQDIDDFLYDVKITYVNNPRIDDGLYAYIFKIYYKIIPNNMFEERTILLSRLEERLKYGL